ncbi:MarR family winged helix-turn-helix transcriptional regulator [Agrobacterium sp. SORGH_AS 787]|uniref:MarR family winged helix-turn-helix transcriptional regulator n=1 Tax=Agrobacterium sp. SORGH_AS 787 TaxID=3041775 RepID=UPI002784B69B|nr:DNA-binding MarR family transcriptional regulator [Rhizobium sp. SORGH_AS_0787]
MQLADLISGVNRQIEQALEGPLKAHGVSLEQYRVFKALAARSGIPMGDLAAQVFVDSPTLTKIVDKMVASADVFRGPDPNDRRRVLVFLSEKGSATFAQLASIGEGVERSFTQSLGAAALNDLSGLLRSVLRESRRPAADKSGGEKSHDTLAFSGSQEV